MVKDNLKLLPQGRRERAHLLHGLIPVPEEPPTAVATHQLGDDLLLGLLDQFGTLHGKGWVADDGEEGCVHLLRTRFPRQQRVELGLGGSHDIHMILRAGHMTLT